jgi:hypothetical protein
MCPDTDEFEILTGSEMSAAEQVLRNSRSAHSVIAEWALILGCCAHASKSDFFFVSIPPELSKSSNKYEYEGLV